MNGCNVQRPAEIAPIICQDGSLAGGTAAQ